MYCFVPHCITATAFACLVAASAIAAEPDLGALTYHPWTKTCSDDICFIGSDGHTDCGLVAGAVLIERKGETKKTLRVMFSNRVRLEAGVRIVIGDNEAIERPYVSCFASGCTADYDTGPELVDELKRARTLALKATDKANSPIEVSLPLVDFAKSYDGLSHNLKVILEVHPTAAEMQARLDRDRRVLEERKARCEAR